MAKISVNVCLGSTCYVKGGALLQELNDIIPQKYGSDVEVAGCPCLGLCSIKLKEAKVPYVKVNDEVVEEATVEKVLAIIDLKLN